MEPDNSWLDELSNPVVNDNSWLDEISSPVNKVDPNDWRYKQSANGIPIGDIQSPAPEPEVGNGELTQSFDDTIYQGRSYEEAVNLYNNLSNTAPGVYKDKNGQNWWVPKPTPDLFGKITGGEEVSVNDPENWVKSTVGDTLRGFTVGATAIRDKTLGKLTGTAYTDDVAKYLPMYPDTGMSKDLSEAAGMLFGGGIASAYSLATMPEKLRKMSGFLGAIARGTRTGAYAVAGETAFAPENASSITRMLFNNIDPNDPRADQIIQNKLNVAIDGVALGIGGALSNQAIKASGSFFDELVTRKVLNFFSKDKREEAVINEFFSKIEAIKGTETPEQRKALRQEFVQWAAENKDIVYNLSQHGFKDVQIVRDTMSAIEEGIKNANPEDAASIIALIRNARKEVLGKDLQGLLEGRLNSVNDQFDELKRSVYDDTVDPVTGKVAGDENINLAGKEIQRNTKETVDTFQKFSDNIQNELDVEKERLRTTLESSLTFGEDIKRRFDEVGIDIKTGAFDSFDNLDRTLQEVGVNMQAAKNQFYNDIPDGATVDMDELGTFFKDVEKKGAKKGESKTESVIEFLPRSLSNKIQEANGNFKTLYNEVLPELGRLQNKAYDARDMDTYNKIKDLRQFINEDSLIYLIENGDEVTADAAIAARDFFKDTYAPIWRDGELERYGNILQGMERKPVETRQKLADSLKVMVSPDKSNYFNHLVDAMSLGEYGGDKRLPINYIIKNAEAEFLTQMMKGKTADEILQGPLFVNLGNYSRQLRDNAPELKQELDNFSNNIREKYSKISNLGEQLTAANKELRNAEIDFYEGEAREFFKKEGTFVGIPKENSLESFSELFNGSDNKKRIANIMSRAMAKPNGKEVVAGLQAAYIKHLNKKLSMTQKTMSNNRKISVPQYDKLFKEGLEGGSHPLLEYGDIVFQDKPEIQTVVRGLLDYQYNLSQSLRSTSAGAQINLNPGQVTSGFKQVYNMFITMVWGPLSRTGARVRSAAGVAVESTGIVLDTNLMIEKIYADPDYFIEVVKRMESADGKTKSVSAWKKATFLTDWLVKSQIFGSPDSGAPYEGDIDELTKDLHQTIARGDYNEEQINERKNKRVLDQLNEMNTYKQPQ